MKDEFLNSYLAKSVKRFYPEGAPADPAQVYPTLVGKRLKPIEQEIADIGDTIKKTHNSKLTKISTAFAGDINKTVNSKVAIVNEGGPIAKTSSDGIIKIDVRVLQAVFRGAVLETARDGGGVFGNSFVASDSDRSSKGAIDPENSTQEQRTAIASLIDKVNKVEAMPSYTMLGDFFRIMTDIENFSDAPWYSLSDVMMNSMTLQYRYAGAISFLVAHEHGHLALSHHKKLDLIKKELLQPGKEDYELYCERRRSLERQADLYALLLLSPYTDEKYTQYIDIMGLGQDQTGYRNFFTYGYPLSGFNDDAEASCTYESNEERYKQLDAVNQVLLNKHEEAVSNMLEKAMAIPKN